VRRIGHPEACNERFGIALELRGQHRADTLKQLSETAHRVASGMTGEVYA
jgi:hypothetical protein